MSVVRLSDRERLRPASPPQATEADRIRRWLQRVLAQGDGAGPYSMERLCRKAGVAPTSISRFMKNGVTTPRISTLSAIARAAGVPAPDVTMTTEIQPLVDIPIILPHVYRIKGHAGAVMASIEAVRAPSTYADCVAVRITADTGALAGVLVGDLVVVDPRTVGADNELLVVALDTGRAGVYRRMGEWLVPQAAGNLPSLPAAESCIIGVARQVQRELR